MNVNVIDILLIIVMLLSLLRGWQRGFLLGVASLFGWAASLLIAFRAYRPVADWLDPRTTWSVSWDRPLAFIVVAIVSGLVIDIILTLLLRRVPQEVHRSAINRALGLLPGAVAGLITIALVATVLLVLPLTNALGPAVRDSNLAKRLAISTNSLGEVLKPLVGQALTELQPIRTIRPESDERVELPFSVDRADPRPDLEARMLELVNQERASAGLAPLSADPELTRVARRHAADMLARGYFAHDTPEGVSPFDRITQAGVSYTTAGENLALAPTLDLAHEGLMNSPGHRANILRPSFGRLGIGILDAGPYGLMVVQNFRD